MRNGKLDFFFSIQFMVTWIKPRRLNDHYTKCDSLRMLSNLRVHHQARVHLCHDPWLTVDWSRSLITSNLWGTLHWLMFSIGGVTHLPSLAPTTRMDQNKSKRTKQVKKRNEQFCIFNGFSFITIEIENFLTITTRIILFFFFCCFLLLLEQNLNFTLKTICK